MDEYNKVLLPCRYPLPDNHNGDVRHYRSEMNTKHYEVYSIRIRSPVGSNVVVMDYNTSQHLKTTNTHRHQRDI